MKLYKNSMTLRILKIAASCANEDAIFDFKAFYNKFNNMYPTYNSLFKVPLILRLVQFCYPSVSKGYPYLTRLGRTTFKIKDHVIDYMIENDLLIYNIDHII